MILNALNINKQKEIYYCKTKNIIKTVNETYDCDLFNSFVFDYFKFKF